MLARIVAPLAFLIVCTTASSVAAQDTSATSGHFLVAGGVNLTSGSTASPMLQLGREWRAPTSRFGIRMVADFVGSSTERPFYLHSADLTPFATLQTSHRSASLGLLSTFALTKGRVQPYLLSGLMLQRRHDSVQLEYLPGQEPVAVDGTSSGVQTYSDNQTSFGLQAGFGVSARVGRTSLFAEYRTQLHSIDAYPMRPNASSPLTIGFRF